MELFASPVCLSPSEGGAVQQMCRADLPCWGVFLPTQDVAGHVSPPHVGTGSEPAGLLEGQGAEVGGPFWSQSLEAPVLRTWLLSPGLRSCPSVSSRQLERTCPVLWSHFTEEETKAQTD